jgi:hypothetical protein
VPSVRGRIALDVSTIKRKRFEEAAADPVADDACPESMLAERKRLARNLKPRLPPQYPIPLFTAALVLDSATAIGDKNENGKG